MPVLPSLTAESPQATVVPHRPASPSPAPAALRRAVALLAVAAAAAACLAAIPVSEAATSSPMLLAATAASGWTNPENVLAAGDDLYAATSADAATLALSDFADSPQRGPITQVTLKLDQQQASHSNDLIDIAVTATGCATVTPSIAGPQPTTARTTLAIDLDCQSGWTWEKVSALSATVKSKMVTSLVFGVDGEWRVFGAWVVVTYTDKPPVADAGADRNAGEGVALRLDGTGSTDPEGITLQFAWEQVDGPAVDLAESDTARPRFTAPAIAAGAASTLTFELTVTDADGQSDTDTVAVHVTNVNGPPVADAGPDIQAEANSLVTLSAASSMDPDGDALNYQWTEVAGPHVDLSGATSAVATFNAPAAAGALRFQLVVHDALGLGSPADIVEVTVLAPAATGDGTPASEPSPTAAPQTTAAPAAPGPVAAPSVPPVSSTIVASLADESAAGSDPAAGRACTAAIPPSPAATSVAVLLQPQCGMVSAVVTVAPSASPLGLDVRSLQGPGTGVPDPPGHPEAAAYVRVTLTDARGGETEPQGAVLRFGVDAAWVAQHCPPAECELKVWHYTAGAWSELRSTRQPDENGRAVIQAQTGSFSTFAVTAHPASRIVAAPPGTPWLLWGGIAVVGMVAAGGGTMLVRRRSSRAAPVVDHVRPATTHSAAPARDPASIDERVSRLVREMRTNRELLQFVNNAAHDLANPLTPINLQLSMLKMAAGADGEKKAKALGVVQRNVDQMAMLITDLRDAARLQAGKVRLALADTDLAQVAADAVESHAAQAEAAGVALTFEGGDALRAQADAGRLTQVLTNFVNNAVKFTPKGGRVAVMVVRELDWAILLVRDTGLGLTAQDRERLFRPFSQVHGEAEKRKGTGLGLFIAKGIAEAHGGGVGCDSAGPGLGSTFWVSLPLAAAPSGIPSPAARAAARPAPRPGPHRVATGSRPPAPQRP